MTNKTATTAELIKQATAPAHASTEKALIQHIKSIHNAQGYASLLYCLYGYFAPMEAHIEALSGTSIPDTPQRRKASRILTDLQALGFPAPQHIALLPVLHHTAEALACQYVLEGSTLGGAVIKKMISAQCPGLPETAFSFFSGYGEHNKDRWLLFLDSFNAALTTATDTRLAINAANACFTGLEEWIDTFYTLLKGGLQ
jgi:heme oxygenase